MDVGMGRERVGAGRRKGMGNYGLNVINERRIKSKIFIYKYLKFINRIQLCFLMQKVT